MLVLSRKKGESIMIGDVVEIMVLGSEGDTVKIGIKAPKELAVYRHEIYNAVKQSNQEAMLNNAKALDLHRLLGEQYNKNEEK